MDIFVNGTCVTLRERYPASEFGDLKRRIQTHDAGANWDADAKLLRSFIEAWDFDGDPQDVQAWGQLDVMDIMALDRAIATEIIEKRIAYSKNATSGPTEESQGESL